MRVIVYTVVCSPLDEVINTDAIVHSKAHIIRSIVKDLEKRIPKGYRCSIVAGVKDK